MGVSATGPPNEHEPLHLSFPGLPELDEEPAPADLAAGRGDSDAEATAVDMGPMPTSSVLTPWGQVEQYGVIARSLTRRRNGAQRRAAKVAMWVFVLLTAAFAIGLAVR